MVRRCAQGQYLAEESDIEGSVFIQREEILCVADAKGGVIPTLLRPSSNLLFIMSDLARSVQPFR